MSDYVACSVADCLRPEWSRGWCSSHYQRWRRYGSPYAGGKHRNLVGPRRKFRDWEKRFWSHVDRSGDCWLWIGARSPQGYGTCSSPHGYSAHRVSWIIANAQGVPNGMFICHTCDNPSCVNPAHLFVGTPADNARDRDTKGRRGVPPLQKLSAEQVREVQRLRANGASRHDIARRFGVHLDYVYSVRRRKDWGAPHE